MRRGCVVAVTLLLVLDLWAGDPWKQKSYKLWSESDVRKIFNESPWAKRIEVEGSQTKHAVLEAPEDGALSEGGAGEESGEGDGRGKDNERGQITFVVRWVSSRTIRQAWVRGEVLQKRISESDTDKFLPPPSDDSPPLIVGRETSLFTKLDEAIVRARSFLLLAKSKQRISPRVRGMASKARASQAVIACSAAFPRPRRQKVSDLDGARCARHPCAAHKPPRWLHHK